MEIEKGRIICTEFRFCIDEIRVFVELWKWNLYVYVYICIYLCVFVCVFSVCGFSSKHDLIFSNTGSFE